MAICCASARDVPDADLVDRAVEESRRRAVGVQRAADRRMLDAVGSWRLTDEQFTFERTVEEELPLRTVVGRGRVIPGAVLDDGHAADRVIQTGRAAAHSFLEVGDQHVAGAVDPEEVVHVEVAGVALAATLRDKRNRGGDAAAARGRADPMPSRRNHASIVNVDAPRPGAGPKVTYVMPPSDRSRCWRRRRSFTVTTSVSLPASAPSLAVSISTYVPAAENVAVVVAAAAWRTRPCRARSPCSSSVVGAPPGRPSSETVPAARPGWAAHCPVRTGVDDRGDVDGAAVTWIETVSLLASARRWPSASARRCRAPRSWRGSPPRPPARM